MIVPNHRPLCGCELRARGEWIQFFEKPVKAKKLCSNVCKVIDNRLLPEHSCLILYIWPRHTILPFIPIPWPTKRRINQSFRTSWTSSNASLYRWGRWTISQLDSLALALLATSVLSVSTAVVQQFYKSSLQHIPMALHSNWGSWKTNLFEIRFMTWVGPTLTAWLHVGTIKPLHVVVY